MARRSRARAAAPAATALLLLLQSVAGLVNETVMVTAPSAAPAVPPVAPPYGAGAGAAMAAPVAPALLSNARRQNHDRSTSSSSGDAKDDHGSGSAEADKKESLDLDTMSDMSGEGSKGNEKGAAKYRPKSSEERRGWRKWHRKCTPCPERDLRWRDPRILWICGGYQRARRSFKSACMMRYRNCQDGTMFVKLYNHRCQADVPGEPRPHGEHFFYTYSVKISGDASKSNDKSSSGEPSVSSDSSAARRRRRVMDWRPRPGPEEPPRARALSANQTVTMNITQNMV